MSATKALVIDGSIVTTEDVWRVAHDGASVTISSASAFQTRLLESRRTLERSQAAGREIYGISTGFGDSVDSRITPEAQTRLGQNLARYHRIGFGAPLVLSEARAVMVARLVSLAQGYSAVRVPVLEQLAALLRKNVVPVIPSRGSVGASGDLTPLAYVAAALMGEGKALVPAGAREMAAAFDDAQLTPIELDPRETLAVMNGTSAMTGLGSLAVERTRRLLRWATALSGLACEALEGDSAQFDPRLVTVKRHPGSLAVASALTADLEHYKTPPRRLQDRYSVRCSPQVLGIALDVLSDAKRYTEIELNGASDNPIFEPEGAILHGGNFYGGHVCHAMDTLHTQIANVADLLERQMVLLCTPHMNAGLPANLVQNGSEHPERHGFKAAQITASALVAEIIKSAMPASVLSRSTENHNQDKVSMGMLAARSCLDALDLAEAVAGIHTLALAQALELRSTSQRSIRGQAIVGALRQHVSAVRDDRPLDADLETVLALHQRGDLPVGDALPLNHTGAA